MRQVANYITLLPLLVGFPSPAGAQGPNFLRSEVVSDDVQRKLSSIGVDCTSIEDFYYTAEVRVSTMYVLERDCSEIEVDEILTFLDAKFDAFVAFNEVLGPLELERSSSTCPVVNNRRRMQQVFDRLPKNEQEYHQRRKLFVPTWAYFNGGGICRYCFGDNKDKRRLQGGKSLLENKTTTSPNLQEETGAQSYVKKDPRVRGRRLVGEYPITLSIGTDGYPEETDYTLRALDGSYLVSRPGTFDTQGQVRNETFWLEYGKEYHLEVTDSYGDGFGDGFADIYAGTSVTGSPIYSLNPDFGAGTSIVFTAGDIHSGITSTTTTEDALNRLQYELNTHLTYHIQQTFHNDAASCLHASHPIVCVILTAATQQEAESMC